ncbi:MAG: hypothetical protein J4452_01880 [Candidatus Aenigmarchaeota archaeon]|nr:hypothetical protein [Candidatus Aenigmarchaeota archaeon]
MEIEATDLYRKILPVAHEIYTSFPKPKQVRTSRQMELESVKNMSGASSHEAGLLADFVRTGIPKYFATEPKMSFEDLEAATRGFRSIVDESANPDMTDPYWERIKGAILIEPHWVYDVPMVLEKENGLGEFKDYRVPEYQSLAYSRFFQRYYKKLVHSNRARDKFVRNVLENLPEPISIALSGGFVKERTKKLGYILKSLVGEKVIFFPLKTVDQLASLEEEEYKVHWTSVPLEFPVHKWTRSIGISSHRGEVETKKVIGKINAEEFNPFSQDDANHVTLFFKENIFPTTTAFWDSLINWGPGIFYYLIYKEAE